MELYEPAGFLRLTLPDRVGGGSASVTLVDDGTLDAAERAEDACGKTMTIYKVVETASGLDVEEVWSGPVESVESDDGWITFTGSGRGLLRVGPMLPVLTDTCIHLFKSTGCGYTGSETWCDGTMTRCQALGREVSHISAAWAPIAGEVLWVGDQRYTVPGYSGDPGRNYGPPPPPGGGGGGPAVPPGGPPPIANS